MEAAKLDVPLDDLVKLNGRKGARRPGRGQQRNSAKRPARTGLKVHDSERSGAGPAVETTSKLILSNLAFSVSEKDLRDLFQSVGPIKRVGLVYDKDGNSKGSAEVIFARKKDATNAMKTYADVKLDGRLLKMEVTSTLSRAPIQSRLSGGSSSRLKRTTTRSTRPSTKKPASINDLDADLDTYMGAPSHATNASVAVTAV